MKELDDLLEQISSADELFFKLITANLDTYRNRLIGDTSSLTEALKNEYPDYTEQIDKIFALLVRERDVYNRLMTQETKSNKLRKINSEISESLFTHLNEMTRNNKMSLTRLWKQAKTLKPNFPREAKSLDDIIRLWKHWRTPSPELYDEYYLKHYQLREYCRHGNITEAEKIKKILVDLELKYDFADDDPYRHAPITCELNKMRRGNKNDMTKYTRHTSEEKIQILMELFNTNIGINELCRKHNLAYATLHSWMVKFFEGGKLALESKTEKHLNDKIDRLTREIDELTIANDILKKVSEGKKR